MSYLRTHFDNWQNEKIICSKCNWVGNGSDLGLADVGQTCSSYACPQCHGIILIVEHPTIQEAEQNWYKLSDADKATVIAIKGLRNRFDKERLKNPNQLPEISEPNFILKWDFGIEGSNHSTLIYLGEDVIFKEPALFEGFLRFVNVCKILKHKYGEALKDLAPTERSELYLYGDDLSSIMYVAAARYHIIGNKELKTRDNVANDFWRAKILNALETEMVIDRNTECSNNSD